MQEVLLYLPCFVPFYLYCGALVHFLTCLLFHIVVQTEVSGFMNTVVNKLDSLTEEIQDLKKENERLRQLL